MSRLAARRWTPHAIAVGVFLAGLASGVAIDRLLADDAPARHGRPRDAAELTQRYRERLDLDAAQVAAVRAILERSFAEMDAIMAPVDPAMTATRQTANAGVRAVLRPAQLPAWEAIVREQEERRAAFRRKPPP